jgi:hypothetical protein
MTKYESLNKFELLYNKKQSDSGWTAKLVIENEIYVNQRRSVYRNMNELSTFPYQLTTQFLNCWHCTVSHR